MVIVVITVKLFIISNVMNVISQLCTARVPTCMIECLHVHACSTTAAYGYYNTTSVYYTIVRQLSLFYPLSPSCMSDPEFASAPTTPSSVYTDAEAEDSLLSAMEEGDFDLAFQLMTHSDSLNPIKVGFHKLTPLHYACQHGRLDVIQNLVENYSYDLSQLEFELPTPLQIAAASGHLHIVKFLMTNTSKLSFKAKKVNPFHLAAEHGKVEVMRFFLDFDGALISMTDHEGNTALHYACCQGHLPTVVFLTEEAKHLLSVKNKRGEMPLHVATKHCHLDVVKFLVDEKHCDLTVKDFVTGSTPIHIAAKTGCLDMVQYLANEKNCDLECKTSRQKSSKSKQTVSGRTPLHYASFAGHCDVVAFLIEDKSCNSSITDDLGFTPLHLACQEGHSEVVRFLLNLSDMEPNQAVTVVTENGITPIHSASLSGNLEVVKLLIDQNDGDNSCIDSEGRTALHYSSIKGHTDIVKYLLEGLTANPNCVDQSFVTPLHLAAQYGHMDTLQYLVSEGNANAELMEENGYTPLHLAANKGRLPVVEFLIGKRHSNVMVRDKTGRTPLHHACQSGHLDVVQFLTGQADCDCSCQEKNLKATPLHLAASFGHLDVVRFLVDEKGCSPMSSDKFNSTPIHRAAASGHCDIMNYFIKEKQCSSILKNKFGNTPLHLACQKGKFAMVELLLSFSKENMTARNQVGRMPLDLSDQVEILSIFIKNGIDPSKGSISIKFPYLKFWEALSLTTKIFLLGDLATGKSTLAKTLRGGGFFQEWVTGRFQRVTPPDAETSGIMPINFDSKHFGRVVLYDFAGHSNYHASHSVILSLATRHSSPIFLVTVDLRNSPDILEKSITYWSSLIHSSVGDQEPLPHAFLVGTHEDELSKDELRHKPALLDQIVLLSSESSLKFKGWIALDCRKPNSTSIHKLRQFISQRCDNLQSGTRLDHNCCLLRSFILYKFQGTIVIEFEELVEYLSHTIIPEIKEREKLHQACLSLHSRGYLLFLESKDSDESSWIIHNQEAILSMVHGFHKMVDIPNPLGVVSISQLQTSLGTIGFNVSLAIRYLLRMEFCMKLADRRVLYSISGFQPPHPLEDHLFFPHLVRSSAPTNLWTSNKMATQEKHFGWFMECVEKYEMLGPRFLQLLLLRLASHFPFNTNPNFPFRARKSSCVIWSNGLHWVDMNGIDSLVELQKDSRAVIFVARTRKENKSDLTFYQFRSAVMNEIRAVRKEACSLIHVTESLIHPECLLDNLFLSNPEPNLALFKLSNIQAALMDSETSATLTAEQLIHGDSLVEVSVDVTMDLKKLLLFDPFMGLPRSVLIPLLSSQKQEVTIPLESYDNICDSLVAMNFRLEHLLVMLRLPYPNTGSAATRSRSCGDTSLVEEMRALFRRWEARVEEGRTFGELKNLFSLYSVLDTSELIVE